MPDRYSPSSPPMMEIPSPCIGVCHLDELQVCEGCGRTLDEIAAWSAATSGQRQLIVERASRRRAAQAAADPDSLTTGQP